MTRIVFFGTPAFAADVLAYLIDQRVEIAGVVSRPDKPQGRSSEPVPNPVKKVAELHHLPQFQPTKVSSPDFIPILKGLQADMFIVVAYGEILSQQVLDLPKIACLNLHASLLPRYRGAAPIQQAIIQGEFETGISIIHMVKKMDAGDVILKLPIPILENMTYGMLEKIMRKEGAKALFSVIVHFDEMNVLSEKQDESLVTFAPKIELEDCEIDWVQPAKNIHNLIRGVNPEPGAWCFISIREKIKRLKIYSTHINTEILLSPKQLYFDPNKKLYIGCKEGTLEILEVQLEGKKRMSASDFYRGFAQNHLKII